MRNLLVNPGKNKKPSSVEKISASQLSRIDEICEEIKKGDQNYSEKTVRTNGAPGKCKRLIKEGVTPETLFAKLGESLIEQKEYYITTFLPALLRETIQSEKLGLDKIEQVLRITSGIVKQSSEEEYNYYIETFLPALKTEIPQKLDPTKRTKIEKIIMDIITSDAISKIVGDPNPLVPSEQNPPQSPISSRRSSISTTLSSVGGDDEIPNNLNTPPEEIRKKYDEVMKQLTEHKNLYMISRKG